MSLQSALSKAAVVFEHWRFFQECVILKANRGIPFSIGIISNKVIKSKVCMVVLIIVVVVTTTIVVRSVLMIAGGIRIVPSWIGHL
jgi:hypothetical protein